MKLSDKLIVLRKGKGWSQEDFAEKLDVSRQAISRWENETALPDAPNILRISKLFNVTADYLLNDDYEGEIDIPMFETATEATTPLIRKKRYFYWWLIPVICFVILSACAILGLTPPPIGTVPPLDTMISWAILFASGGFTVCAMFMASCI